MVVPAVCGFSRAATTMADTPEMQAFEYQQRPVRGAEMTLPTTCAVSVQVASRRGARPAGPMSPSVVARAG